MKQTLAFFAILALLGGCAKNLSSDEYSEDDAGSVTETYRGTVLSVRKVKVKGGDKLEDNTAGLVGGGLAGGILGSHLGKGSGSAVGLVAGAAAGALGGSLLQKGLKTQNALEYTVELTTGRIVTIVQGSGAPIAVGQPVLVMMNSRGRSRIVLDQTPRYPAATKAPAASNQGRRGKTLIVIED